MTESSGTTLMDLISSDSTTALPPHSPSAAGSLVVPPQPTTQQVDRKSKRGTLMQIQSDTISAAKAAAARGTNIIMPRKRHKKK